MKKIILTAAAVIMAVTVSACGAGTISQSGERVTDSSSAAESTVSSQAQVSSAPAVYDKNLGGLSQSMKDKGYVTGDPTVMKADFIGAKDGVKYEAVFEKTKFTIELYEYDTSALNDKAKEYIDQVKSTGTFTYPLLPSNPTAAVLSNNGKYLMVYTDTSAGEGNAAHRQEVETYFKAFQ